MNILELIKVAFIALNSNKTRTALTMLGIVIGIASVIVMLGIGNGAQQSITNSLSTLGTNLLTITAGAQRSGLVQQGAGTAATLTDKDADAIADKNKIQNINAVSPELSSTAQIVAGAKNESTTVYGVTDQYPIVHSYQVGEGGFISAENVLNTSRVAVIGPDTATTLFGTLDPIGQSIKVANVHFTVIGITIAKGSSGITSQDDVVFIPLSTAQNVVFGIKNLRTISVQVNSATNINQAQTDITTLLLARHKIANTANADFTIRNSATTLSTLSSITGIFTILLASIASISLLVGGIGIMNIMIVTVTERTREIGLRKAIGAQNKIILLQFLIEAIVLTLLSGIIGTILGIGTAELLATFASITVAISLSSIFLSTGVSLFVGIVFGIYPAYKASKLSPIEALRYE